MRVCNFPFFEALSIRTKAFKSPTDSKTIPPTDYQKYTILHFTESEIHSKIPVMEKVTPQILVIDNTTPYITELRQRLNAAELPHNINSPVQAGRTWSLIPFIYASVVTAVSCWKMDAPMRIEQLSKVKPAELIIHTAMEQAELMAVLGTTSFCETDSGIVLPDYNNAIYIPKGKDSLQLIRHLSLRRKGISEREVGK